jgi:hypothetical protein
MTILGVSVLTRTPYMRVSSRQVTRLRVRTRIISHFVERFWAVEEDLPQRIYEYEYPAVASLSTGARTIN